MIEVISVFVGILASIISVFGYVLYRKERGDSKSIQFGRDARKHTRESTIADLFFHILIKSFKTFREMLLFMIALCIIILLGEKIGKPFDPEDQRVLQNFIEWYAIFFSLALSLIIGNGWIKYNKINSEIDREADALKLLIQSSSLSRQKELSSRLALAVQSYVGSVIKSKVEHGKTGRDLTEKTNLIRENIQRMVQDENVEEYLKSELIRLFNEANNAREDRFDLIGRRLPSNIWLIMIIFSFIWLLGFYWIGTVSKFGTYVLAATVFSVSFLFYLARDLDDPVRGAWRISFGSFKEGFKQEQDEKMLFDDYLIKYETENGQVMPIFALSLRTAVFTSAVLLLFTYL